MTARTTRALAAMICAALLLTLLASCGRKHPVVKPTVTTESTAEQTETTSPPDRDSDHVICIDPGHGFGDSGHTSQFIDENEQNIALAFAKLLSDELTGRGYAVLLTHDGKSFPRTEKDNGDGVFDDAERASFADEANADYLISIHCGAYYLRGAEGVEGARVYYSADSKFDPESVRAACDAISAHLNAAFPEAPYARTIETPKEDSYQITCRASCCSLLLELGFLTSETDAKNMTDADWLEAAVTAVADAVDEYFVE